MQIKIINLNPLLFFDSSVVKQVLGFLKFTTFFYIFNKLIPVGCESLSRTVCYNESYLYVDYCQCSGVANKW